MNAPTGNLFATQDAVAVAARNLDLLRRLADSSAPPASIRALAVELGRPAIEIDMALTNLKNRDLVADCADRPDFPFTLTRQGALAALGVGVATGEAEVDLDARLIAHDRLKPNPLNPRKAFDEAALAELADSIEANLHRGGILQNLVVFPADDEGVHVIFAGERRWRAVALLIERGVVDVGFRLPCRVREPDELQVEAQTAFVALSENGQRQNLTMLEQARAYRVLVERGDLSAAEAARRTGRDKRTVQEMLKVLAEARPADIDAHERGEMKWEELRDSVKTVKLSPAQALIVLEVAARMDSEEPAAYEDEDGPDWIEAAFAPVHGPQVDLVARGLLQFQVQDETVLCRLRTDNPRLEGWLDASFGCEPGERRSLDPDKRDAVLFQARAAELGSFEARQLEEDDKWATPWLNVATPTLAEIQADLPPLEGGAPPEARGGPQLEGPADDDELYLEARELVIRDRKATAAYIQRKLQLSYNRAFELTERLEREGIIGPMDHTGKREVLAPDPAEGVLGRGDTSHEPAAQPAAPAPAKPEGLTPHQRLILAEILHKSESSDGAQIYALIRRGTMGGSDRAFGKLFEIGLIMGRFSLGPNGEDGVQATENAFEALGLTQPVVTLDDITRVREEARKGAGLSLAERHELAQTGRYAWEPLNTAAPKPAEPPAADLPELAPETALALVELAAAIARDGVTLPGKPWRCIRVFDYHLHKTASEFGFHRVAAWVTHDGQWYGYLKERGEAWLKANGLVPIAVTAFDAEPFRQAAKVEDPGPLRWSTPFLNPKAAPPTGPQRDAAEPEPATPAEPPAELFIRFGETGQHIREWRSTPFDGATRYVRVDADQERA